MATTYSLAAKYFLDFNAALTASYGTNATQNTIVDSLVTGGQDFAAIKNTLDDGTAANQAQEFWHDRRSVAGGANDDLDLNNASLTNAYGQTVAMTRAVWFLLRLTSPATGVRLVIGNAPTNTWTAWFGAAAHTEEVRDITFHVNQIDAWTISGTNKVLRINNPTGSAIQYDIIVIGSP
jgi:hypothetical protein